MGNDCGYANCKAHYTHDHLSRKKIIREVLRMNIFTSRDLLRKTRSFICAFLVLAVLALPSAAAEFTSSFDKFVAENPGLSLQRFNSLVIPATQFANCDSPVNSQSNDQCFTPGFIAPALEFLLNDLVAPQIFALLGSNVLGSGNPPNVLIASFNQTSFNIDFPASPARVVGFYAGCISEGEPCISEVTVQVFGEGPVVIGETTILINSQFDTFLGVEYTEPIRRVSIISTTPNVFQGVERVLFELGPDVNPIPTLSEWGMIAAATGFALIGMFYAMRKRRASA